jgi:hypothetical protein
VGDTWMLRRRLLQAGLWVSGTGRRVARHGREMFRAFGAFVLLHTGEGINALVDMIDVALIWFGGSRALSVGLGLNVQYMYSDRTFTAFARTDPVPWSAFYGVMGWKSRRPSGYSRAINFGMQGWPTAGSG